MLCSPFEHKKSQVFTIFQTGLQIFLVVGPVCPIHWDLGTSIFRFPLSFFYELKINCIFMVLNLRRLQTNMISCYERRSLGDTITLFFRRIPHGDKINLSVFCYKYFLVLWEIKFERQTWKRFWIFINRNALYPTCSLILFTRILTSRAGNFFLWVFFFGGRGGYKCPSSDDGRVGNSEEIN